MEVEGRFELLVSTRSPTTTRYPSCYDYLINSIIPAYQVGQGTFDRGVDLAAVGVLKTLDGDAYVEFKISKDPFRDFSQFGSSFYRWAQHRREFPKYNADPQRVEIPGGLFKRPREFLVQRWGFDFDEQGFRHFVNEDGAISGPGPYWTYRVWKDAAHIAQH